MEKTTKFDIVGKEDMLCVHNGESMKKGVLIYLDKKGALVCKPFMLTSLKEQNKTLPRRVRKI